MAAPAVPTVGTVPRVRLPKPRFWRALHAFGCQRASLGTMSIDAPAVAPHSDDPLLVEIRAKLAQAPRMHGYYLLRLIRSERTAEVDEAARLDWLLEQLDDRPWAPTNAPQDPADGYQVDEATAAAHAVTMLVGGADVGHARDTMSPASAASLWTQFRTLFAPSARCFIGLGFGDPAYVFLRGVAVIDDTRAGYLGVVESD